jgi:Ca2+-binding RTX toxin-like protein
VLNADGSKTETVTDLSANGTLVDKTVTTTSADGRSRTVQADSTGAGRFDHVETSIVDSQGSTVDTVTDYNADGSVKDRAVTTTSANGLSVTTQRDTTGALDAKGNPVFDQIDADITVLNADGSTIETVTCLNDGKMAYQIVTTTSANGLSRTTQWDDTGAGTPDLTETNVATLNADGSTVKSSTHTNADGSLHDRTITTTSADGKTVNVQLTRESGSSTELRQQNVDGSTTVTIADYRSDGSLLDRSVTTTSASGLSITTQRDTTGGSAFDQKRTDVTVLNADGSRTETVSDYGASGALQDQVVTTTSANQLSKVVHYDLTGSSTFAETKSDVTVLSADGSSTETVTYTYANGALISQFVETVSANGLSVVKQWDTTGNGVFDQSATDVKQLNADGSVIETVTYYAGQARLSEIVTTTSADKLTQTVQTDPNSDSISETKSSQTTINADGSRTTTVSTSGQAAGGTFLNEVQTVTSADGRTVTVTRSGDFSQPVTGISGQPLKFVLENFYQTQTTVTEVDGSVFSTLTDYSSSGVKDRAISRTSADGLLTTTQWDLDGNGSIDRTRTDRIVNNLDGSRTETIIDTNSDSTLFQEGILTTSADGRTRTLQKDTTGQGYFDLREVTTVNPDGSTTTTTTNFAASGEVVSVFVTSVSADGLSETVRNENGVLTSVTRKSIDGSEVTTAAESTTAVSPDGLTATTQGDDGSSQTVLTNIDGSSTIDRVGNLPGYTYQPYELVSTAGAFGSGRLSVKGVAGQMQITISGNGNSVDADIPDTPQLGVIEFIDGSNNVAQTTSDTLEVSSGSGNTLIATSPTAILMSNGAVLKSDGGANTLVGSGLGDTLIDATGQAEAFYAPTYENLGDIGIAIDLQAGTAGRLWAGSAGRDTLLGVTRAEVSGGSSNVLSSSAAGSNVLGLIHTSNSTLLGRGSGDTLIDSSDAIYSWQAAGDNVLIAAGTHNTLIAAAGSVGATLLSNGAGNILEIADGSGEAYYSADSVTVNLSSETAKVNGSAVSDTLIGVNVVVVAGHNDTALAGDATSVLISSSTGNTLEGGRGSATLMSQSGGNVLVAGSGPTVAYFAGGYNTTIAVSSGATIGNCNVGSDSLIGISILEFGDDGPSSGRYTVVDSVADQTLIGTGSAVLVGSGSGQILLATGDQETLTASGTNDVLLAKGGHDTLLAGGSNNTLVATETSGLLVGSLGGDTLVGGPGEGEVMYALDSVVVNLSTGMASGNALPGDTLVGVTIAEVSGAGDVVLGSGSVTMSATGNSDTLISSGNGAVLNATGYQDALLAAGTGALLNASGIRDIATSVGNGNTLLAANFADVLDATSSGNTLISTAAYVTMIAAGNANTLSAAGAGDLEVATGNDNTLAAYGDSDLIIAFGSDNLLVAAGFDQTVDAGGSGNILSAGTGVQTTLVGHGIGNTLVAGAGLTTAFYAEAKIAVDLAAATATGNGLLRSDTLIGIATAIVAGEGDTLIGGSGTETLVASGDGDTVIGGTGPDVLFARGRDDTLYGSSINSTLIASNSSDTLIGSNGETLIGSVGGDVLVGADDRTTVHYSNDNVVVDLSAGTAAVETASAFDTLVGVTRVIASGLDDTLTSAKNRSALTATGRNDTLIAKGADSTLLALGDNDVLFGYGGGDALIGDGTDTTLIGSGSGDTLIAAADSDGQVLSYGGNDLFVDLEAGIGGNQLTPGVDDRLYGFSRLTVAGSGNTLVGSGGNSTLIALGSGNTLIGGSGTTTLRSVGSGNTFKGGAGKTEVDFDANNIVVDLASGFASHTPQAGMNDVLIGITSVSVVGNSNFLRAAGDGGTLIAYGQGNTLVGADNGSGTLIDVGGSNDTLAAGFGGRSTLIGSDGDTYLFDDGDGQDIIYANDGKVLFGADLGPENLWLTRSGLDLLIQVIGKDGSLTIKNVFSGESTVVIVGGDGSTIDVPALASLTASTAQYIASNPTFDPTTASHVPYDTSLQAAIQQGWTAPSFVGVRTLLGADGITTLESTPSGNTLSAGQGPTTALYMAENVVVEIDGLSGAGTATGPSGVDRLLGIKSVIVSGNNDTLIAYGAADTLEGGKGSTTLVSNLGAGSGGNTLIGGSGPTVALYSGDWLRIDLGIGLAKLFSNGGYTADALYGINVVDVTGVYNSVTGSKGVSTLVSNGSGNLLFAGSEDTVAYYGLNGMMVDLRAGEAYSLSVGYQASGSDSLFNFWSAIVAGSGDVLTALGAKLLEATGFQDTIVGSAATLIAMGYGDTLFDQGYRDLLVSNGGGNTLLGGFSAEASYAGDNFYIDLGVGQARLGGADTYDRLFGIPAVSISGIHNTMVGGNQASTLISSNGNDNTLIAGSALTTLVSMTVGGNTLVGGVGASIAAFTQDRVVVDLSKQTAFSGGTGLSDTLVGIDIAAALGNNDTLVGGDVLTTLMGGLGGANTLISGAAPTVAFFTTAGDPIMGALKISIDQSIATLVSGLQAPSIDTLLGIDVVGIADPYISVTETGGTHTLLATGDFEQLIAGGGGSTLIASGSNDRLNGGSGNAVLEATGYEDTLIGGTGAETLIGAGTNTTLIATGSGNTLVGSSKWALAYASSSNFVIDLGEQVAQVNGSPTRDILENIHVAEASSLNDTIIGGSGTDTLFATVGSDTLIGGSGQTTLLGVLDGGGELLGDTFVSGNGRSDLVYGAGDQVTIDLLHQRVINGGGLSDTLVGIQVATASGYGSTLVAGAGTDTLMGSSASDNVHFQLERGGGQATILDSVYRPPWGPTSVFGDEIDFGPGITDNQLWFRLTGTGNRDLEIDLVGTTSKIVVSDWEAGTNIRSVTAGSHHIDTSISQLIQAMAVYSENNPSFDPSAPNLSQIPQDGALQSAIASAWK